MSTRKSELGSPLDTEATPPAHRDEPSACDMGNQLHSSTLSEAKGVRPQIKKLFMDLQQLQGRESHAVWPNKKRNNQFYQKWYRVRSEYQQAVRGEIDNPFTIDDLRLLTCLVGSGGPQDQALGENALGAIEHVNGRWRWTFKDISTSVVGEWHDTEAAAVADLAKIQSLLFPPDPK